MTTNGKGPHVYTAILQVASAMSREGLRKDRVADAGAGGRYRFRGVDDVMNALSPHLVEAMLVILPRVIDRVVSERTNDKGKVITYACVTVEFDLVSCVDGSKHTIATMGEAMDHSDKATNKAMSAAYKYAAFQAFCIPTEGDNDAENHNFDRSPGPSRDLTTPLAASVSDWRTFESKQQSLLRAASKSGKGALNEAWLEVNEELRRSKAPKEVVDALVATKDELKEAIGAAAVAAMR